MITQVVIIRHGQSEKDKRNPNRGITEVGKSQIKSAAQALKVLAKGKRVVLIASNTPRAQQSAGILSKALTADILTFPKLRVENLDLLSEDPDKLFNLYFKSFEEGELPKAVLSPKEMAGEFLNIIGGIKGYDMGIIVGHSVALEAFANYQQIFLPGEKVDELGYGEFFILKKKGKNNG